VGAIAALGRAPRLQEVADAAAFLASDRPDALLLRDVLRAPGDTPFRAVKLDVLRVEADKIVAATTFGPDLFPALGLVVTLEPGE
jgi:hypothetical protein